MLRYFFYRITLNWTRPLFIHDFFSFGITMSQILNLVCFLPIKSKSKVDKVITHLDTIVIENTQGKTTLETSCGRHRRCTAHERFVYLPLNSTISKELFTGQLSRFYRSSTNICMCTKEHTYR